MQFTVLPLVDAKSRLSAWIFLSYAAVRLGLSVFASIVQVECLG